MVELSKKIPQLEELSKRIDQLKRELKTAKRVKKSVKSGRLLGRFNSYEEPPTGGQRAIHR